MKNLQTFNDLFWVIFTLGCLDALLIYYYFIIKPQSYEKKTKGFTSQERKEINQLFEWDSIEAANLRKHVESTPIRN